MRRPILGRRIFLRAAKRADRSDLPAVKALGHRYSRRGGDSSWKIEHWDGMLYLFEEKCAVPPLPPEAAAYLGAAGWSRFFPVLWFWGCAGVWRRRDCFCSTSSRNALSVWAATKAIMARTWTPRPAILAGVRNRLSGLFDRFWAYLAFRGGARSIVGESQRQLGR